MNKGIYNQDHEVTCSCTRKRSSIKWDIAREMYVRDVCRIAAMLCDSMLCCMPCGIYGYVKLSYDASYAKNDMLKRKKECNKLSGDKSPVSCPPSEVGLSYGKSKSIVMRRVSNLQAVADTRWRSMAGRTVKCGKRCRYAFCSF
ncbi:hypothetical protein TIFTF001_039856 [Ficus carica]|uniref:Uncharacterized protein n=1 Tax=Ficus carica TaxID=3494 RepID=A0AA87YR01_FICCA|nr:hypothetical protein TIFTF001_039856 [Ficus carica]